MRCLAFIFYVAAFVFMVASLVLVLCEQHVAGYLVLLFAVFFYTEHMTHRFKK